MSTTYEGLTHTCDDPDCHVAGFIATLGRDYRILALLDALDERDAWIEEHALVKTLAQLERAESERDEAVAKVARVAEEAEEIANANNACDCARDTCRTIRAERARISARLRAALADPSPTDEGGEGA